MMKTILAASVFTLGLAGSAMAQYATGTTTTVVTDPAMVAPGPVVVDPTPDAVIVDRTVTGSIDRGPVVYGRSDIGANGAMEPCAYSTFGPINNAGVNDKYCGK